MKISIINYPLFGVVVMVSFACIPWLFDLAGYLSPLKKSGEYAFPGLVIFVLSAIGVTYISNGIFFYFLSLFNSNKE